jgi:hypothetical protein
MGEKGSSSSSSSNGRMIRSVTLCNTALSNRVDDMGVCYAQQYAQAEGPLLCKNGASDGNHTAARQHVWSGGDHVLIKG